MSFLENLLVGNPIPGNGRLGLDESDDSGGIVEGLDKDSGTLNRLVLVDNVLDLSQLNTLTTKFDLA